MFAGKARQGLNPRKRLELLRALKPLAMEKCPFVNLPTGRTGPWGEGVSSEDMENYVWVKPKLVAEIKFAEWTSGGVLRHAEFAGLRDDKAAEEVVAEDRSSLEASFQAGVPIGWHGEWLSSAVGRVPSFPGAKKVG